MRYIAQPVEVDAFQIRTVGDVEPNGKRALDLENSRQVFATPEMLARMTPAPGDYVVVQSDGYVYLNPKDVFERKYRPA